MLSFAIFGTPSGMKGYERWCSGAGFFVQYFCAGLDDVYVTV